MTKISVVIVDDQDVDRYIVRRRLSKAPEIGNVIEASAGKEFLEDFFNGSGADEIKHPPLMVLMDINMPGMNGFETVKELQRRMAEGRGPESVVIMMFTSSDNPEDRRRAEELDAVKGFIVKPLDDSGVEDLLSLYHA